MRIVIAGNHREAQHWRIDHELELDGELSLEVMNVESVLGLHITDEDKVYKVGTWYRRRDVEEVFVRLEAAGWNRQFADD